MSILKTDDQIANAAPMIEQQGWLLVMFEGAIGRSAELRRKAGYMPSFPEVRDTADVLFFGQDQKDEGKHIVAMAADPGTGNGKRLLGIFVEWGVANGLTLHRTLRVEGIPAIAERLAALRSDSDGKGPRRGCFGAVLVATTLAGGIVWGVLHLGLS
mgnify:CR=1 FL=1